MLETGKLKTDDTGFFELDGRSVLAIKAGDSGNVGLVHGASRTGQTKYVEPRAVVGPTNDVRAASASRRAEEYAALQVR